MPNLDNDILAFDKLRADLEAHHMGKWVVLHDQQLKGSFASFDEAARAAVEQFGRGPYLIRQVGAPPVVLPASVMYHFANG